MLWIVVILQIIAVSLWPSQPASAQDLHWSTDIGVVGTAGDSSFDDSTQAYHIKGAGTGLAGAADAFHFAYYQIVRGDGQITVRLSSADALSQTALVVRESLNPDAVSTAVVVSNGTAAFVRRVTAGNGSLTGAATGVNVPCWLRLVRSGATITASASTDGQTWTDLGSDTVNMGSAAFYAGLAVSNGYANATNTAMASFDTIQTSFLSSEGLTLWLKADEGVVRDSAGIVSTWADQSGNNHDTVAVNSNGPRWLSGIINDQPAVRFANNAGLNLPDNLMAGADAGDLFLVLRSSAPATAGRGLLCMSGGYGDWMPYWGDGMYYEGFGSSQRYGPFVVSPGLRQLSLFNLTSAPGQWTARLNGQAQFTSSANTVSFPSSGLKLGVSAEGVCFEGDIAEVVLFNRALSASERQAWADYLNTKYQYNPAPAAPKHFSVAPLSATQMAVFWNAGTGDITAYNVERQAADGSWTLLTTLGPQARSYIDSNLTPGTQYAYRITVAGTGFSSLASNPVSAATPTTAPSVPDTSHLALWLRPDLGVTKDANGQVSAWADLSGHENDALQPDPLRQPQWIDGVINNRPVLRFDGSDDMLSTTNAVIGNSPNATILAVVRLPDASTHGAFVKNGLYAGFAFGVGNGSLDDSGNNAIGLYDYVRWLPTGQAWGVGTVLAEMSLDASGSPTIYRNGSALGNLGAGGPAASTGPTFIGGYQYDTARYFRGDIAEVLMFDHAFSTAEREAWKAYLNAKYNFFPAPPTPTQMVGSALSPTQAALTWVDSFQYIDGYKVERQGPDGIWSVVATLGSDATSYFDSSLTAATQYGYRVTATNSAGDSLAASASISTPAIGGAVPLGNLRLWLRADSGISSDTNGLISRWTDYSGQHHDAHQENAGAQPTLLAGALNGRPALHFDGNDLLALPAATMAGATAGEMFVVVRTAPTAGTGSGLVRFGNQTYGEVYYPNSDGRIYDCFGSSTRWDTGAAAVNLGEFHLYNAVSTTSEWVNRLDGVEHFTSRGSGATNTVGFTEAPTIGSSWINLQGDIAEVLVFDHALSASERETVERYVNVRYGILATATPTIPTLNAARAISSTQVSLSWNDGMPVSQSTITYIVERAPGNNSIFEEVAEISDATSYVDDNLTANASYVYRVRARNAVGFSDYSDNKSVTTSPGETVLKTGLRLWLKADAGVSGSKVGMWLDQSGSGHDAHQENAGAQPTLLAGALNGRPALHFDGNDLLALPAATMAGATAGEMFVVVRTAPTAGTGSGLVRFGNQTYGEVYYPNSDGRIYDCFGSSTRWDTGAAAVNLGEFHLYNAVSTTSEWVNRLDGVEHFTSRGSGATNTVGFTEAPTIGSSWINLQGDIAEVLVFDHALSASERDRVEWYLAAKYFLPSYDLDKDGLSNSRETELGTDPYNPDTNGDGISDGVSVQLGINPTSTGGFHYATPPNPSGNNGNTPPPPNPNDHTPPVITLTAPANAVPLP